MDFSQLINEIVYKAVRSSGSGGQHVNKVATKIQLSFDLFDSAFFNEEEKERLKAYLQNRLTNRDVLMLSCGESRSQFKNKTIVTRRFLELIEEGLREDKVRLPTKIPRAIKQKRLLNKKKTSEKKANRKPPKID
ncbi:alternative ribosome rescue aminoacyl-tRNA hydrolase ArfB [Winogradskyella haliclonae]|uniref:Aminoacyl-tRNA hydrolase n=1 Tax=Winogradskyella haliclonae TaxID=2048558 RepID=A0ABQ2BU02_9FLAO|nr:alternative ribosome rescue aminoacyl-tRNA hydrolase ArfB [Winogradskyella haliclonae]GGI55930.1 aminoacyl-tRNA hydrolase [Winogradskyella haliclonae]